MPERELELDPEHTALVVIDRQRGAWGYPQDLTTQSRWSQEVRKWQRRLRKADLDFRSRGGSWGRSST